MTSLSQSLTTVTISDINIVNATQVGKHTATWGFQQTVSHSTADTASASIPRGR